MPQSITLACLAIDFWGNCLKRNLPRGKIPIQIHVARRHDRPAPIFGQVLLFSSAKYRQRCSRRQWRRARAVGRAMRLSGGRLVACIVVVILLGSSAEQSSGGAARRLQTIPCSSEYSNDYSFEACLGWCINNPVANCASPYTPEKTGDPDFPAVQCRMMPVCQLTL